MENCSINNCDFYNGLIIVDDKKQGIYEINNTNFTNINSNYGSIINIKPVNRGDNTDIKINSSFFENIRASKYGGIVYSLSKSTPNCISFNECQFLNVSASFGNIVYSLDKDSEPVISNMDEIKIIKGNVATNPTKLKFNDNSPNKVALFSGNKLPEGISCKY